MAFTILAALGTNFTTSLADGLASQNVSYFTNQSNLMFAIVLMAGALKLPIVRWRHWDSVRGSAAFYLLMTGLIFAFLIAPLSDLVAWNMDWQGVVLHRFAPVFAVLDWVFVRERIRSSGLRVMAWVIYPIVYLVGMWVRGAADGFYPYDFLNPELRGWPAVAGATAAVFVVFVGVAYAVHAVGGARATLPETPESRRE